MEKAPLHVIASIAEKSTKDICLAFSDTEEDGGKTQGGLGSCSCNVQTPLTISDTPNVQDLTLRGHMHPEVHSACVCSLLIGSQHIQVRP